MSVAVNLENKNIVNKSEFVSMFKTFQQDVIRGFENLEPNGASFEQTPWKKKPDDMLQGGGIMAVMRGETFEKVGVNFSEVHGTFSDAFTKEIPGAVESGGKFWASGVSLVAHPKNPYAPTTHMNIRRIETSQSWVGGGADLTPTFEFQEDTTEFHDALKVASENHHVGAYAEYKKWCDEYFFLPHRNETRGVGGTFFDNLNSGDEAKDMKLLEETGYAFLKSYCNIMTRRKNMKYEEKARTAQEAKRGRYVEFNLLYDRGTRFGFQTGGNTEAILMSMPPVATWK